MTNIRFTAPEVFLTGAETRTKFSMNIWSLGVLIFNIYELLVTADVLVAFWNLS
jgi:hypothetical protein